MTDLATYAVLAAAGIVMILQAIKLWAKDRLLKQYKEMAESVIDTFHDIADGRAEVRRLDEKNVRVFPKN